ncbi:MAG: hypothetical protein R3221_11445 [Spongiibacter sp.]|uniref:Transcriptional regulator SutA RNAP-binding domain-containing protein n=1 Tax=Spongiibacter thalassae TaxID=2721624 RepID=A0ABX1GK74_9GAMM|nr:hypothetical protein [Spongiibacter thalassae]MDX1506324.1 hypothetical protein [Spongiibacter sp.]NKI19581.1 hypothetical protein [Spongiibacter thalassae]
MGSRIRNSDNIKKEKYVAYQQQTMHDRMREQLSNDVEAFLARGGEIKHLEPHMRSSLLDNDSDQDSY